jgi:hypothetical protein
MPSPLSLSFGTISPEEELTTPRQDGSVRDESATRTWDEEGVSERSTSDRRSQPEGCTTAEWGQQDSVNKPSLIPTDSTQPALFMGLDICKETIVIAVTPRQAQPFAVAPGSAQSVLVSGSRDTRCA